MAYLKLVKRSSSDDDLAACVWSRPEIPRQHLLELFANASESVKLKLTKKDPRKANIILEIVAQVSNQNPNWYARKIAELCRCPSPCERVARIGWPQRGTTCRVAHAGKFDETAVALSLMCDLPITLIERALVEERSEQIIVIAKATSLAWENVKLILLLQEKVKNDAKHKLEQHFETFMRLRADTAKKAIQFYRLRERATKLRRQ